MAPGPKAWLSTLEFYPCVFSPPKICFYKKNIPGHLNLSTRDEHLFLMVNVKQIIGPSMLEGGPGDCKAWSRSSWHVEGRDDGFETPCSLRIGRGEHSVLISIDFNNNFSQITVLFPGGGNSKIFGFFTLNLGEMMKHFDDHIFKNGLKAETTN